jgi:tyrosyl-tRNA synthetase
MKSIDEQVAILMQGTDYGDEETQRNMAAELRERLKEGRPLKVYCGYDPRTTDLHVGHTITMRKLRQFQELGHEVTFLIGTFTSLVGDPSDQDKTRSQLALEQAITNARTYSEQAFKILDREKTIIRYNHEWLSKLTFADLIGIASNFTVGQFLARENFAKRITANEPIYLHETFYALMQAYDACAMQTDVQVGGSDQLFNIIVAGRKLMQAMGQRPQIGIIMRILPGTDGTVKMSKSLGNHIPLMATPEDMYGKVMSIPDQAMPSYFKLVTRFQPKEIAEIETKLNDGSLHPRDAKMKLAREIVSIFHGDQAAQAAEENFKNVFQKGELPEDMALFSLSAPLNIIDLIFNAGLAETKSEARRLIKQGGVKLDGHAVTDAEIMIEPPGNQRVLQVGKRRFARLA